MTWRRYEVHLAGQVPRLGTGRRFVWARVGRKRVSVVTLDTRGRVYHRARVDRATWDRVPIVQDLGLERKTLEEVDDATLAT